MTTDAFESDTWEFRRAQIDGFGGGDIDSEFVLAKTGRDVGMRDGVDVGVHADGNRRSAIQGDGNLRNGLDFRFRFTVEAANAFFESETDFGGGFADAGKDNHARIATGREDAVQLTSRDDIESGSETRERSQNS